MYKKIGKRLFDIVVACVALLLIWPILIIVGIFIKMDSCGPVFFVQKRIGRQGKDFLLIKFRTMYFETEKKDASTIEPDSMGRVTRIGKILRKTKIDELPQLMNVLKGEMSIVGPRPQELYYRKYYVGSFRDILKVRPGITELTSIKYINEEENLSKLTVPMKNYYENIFPDKLNGNMNYINSITLKNDLVIIFKTLLIIIFRSIF